MKRFPDPARHKKIITTSNVHRGLIYLCDTVVVVALEGEGRAYTGAMGLSRFSSPVLEYSILAGLSSKWRG